MVPGIVERVETWDSRPFSGGYAALHDLADEGFSGVVQATGALLFMLNGRALDVIDGTIDAFDGTSGTIYVAPHPSLPLLFAMQELDGESYAKYYTEDTSLRETDATLSEANFTGYIELSENVLSGDYYVVYYGGRSMSAAFVGNTEQLYTGDEAFQRANDEVGIYEVIKVDLDLVDIPKPTTGAVDTTTEGDTGGGDALTESDPISDTVSTDPSAEQSIGDDTITALGESESDDHVEPSDARAETEAGTDAGFEGGIDLDPSSSSQDSESKPASESDPTAPPDSGPDDEDSPTADQSSDTETGPDESMTESSHEYVSADSDTSDQGTDPETTAAEETIEEGDAATRQVTSTAEPEADTPSDDPDPFSEEEQWRETRTIPALDPERTDSAADIDADVPTDTTGQAEDASTERPNAVRDQPSQPKPESEPEPQPQSEPATNDTDGSASGSDSTVHEGVPDSDDRGTDPETKLEAQLEQLREQYDEAVSERDALKEERDELRRKIERLESELASLREQTSGTTAGSGERIDPETALEQTNLFIRYGSKSNGTLQKAHDGEASQEEVNANLQIEYHTQFDKEHAVVNGRSFDAYLRQTIEYRFVEWVIEDLLYEIQNTNNQQGLPELYDVLPNIDRAEFRGAITMRNDEGEERRESFDIVIRDRMGQPLIVADLNDARDPATDDMMSSLIESTTPVKEVHDTVGAAFFLTASFFGPDALETASNATSGGLLTRQKKLSFVKTSRKRGYHLCLVEARGDDFHIAVPEL